MQVSLQSNILQELQLKTQAGTLPVGLGLEEGTPTLLSFIWRLAKGDFLSKEALSKPLLNSFTFVLSHGNGLRTKTSFPSSVSLSSLDINSNDMMVFHCSFSLSSLNCALLKAALLCWSFCRNNNEKVQVGRASTGNTELRGR